jgi:hypothetical protein
MKRFFAVAVVVAALVFLMAGKSAYAASQEASPLSGKVVETMDSGGYTYVCLEKDGQKTWVAVPQMKVVKGKNMSFEPGIEMADFESKTLKRKFDKIYFSGGPTKQ